MNFEAAAAEFTRFAVTQGFPPNLLWVKSDEVLLARWNGQWTNFSWKGDPTERLKRARIEFERAVQRNIGIALEGKCKTDRWTICSVYVPVDDEDAQYRMIPRRGVKQVVAVDPLPAILVSNRVLWRVLRWMLEESGRNGPIDTGARSV